jgi:hypothetical protein
MVFLVAFMYVIPPLTLGHYPTHQQCEQDRAAWIKESNRYPTMSNVILVCLGPDIRAERRRFEIPDPKQ